MGEAGREVEDEEITVLIADDHPVVRRGLHSLFDRANGISVVGAAESGEMAVAMARELKPTIVLMDYSMEPMSGLEATRELLKVAPHVRVVMLTSFGDDKKRQAAVEAGAVGYILKDADPQEILEVVRKAARHARVADATDA